MFAVASGVFSVLLLATGTAKLRHPQYTATALRALRIPGGVFAVVVLGVVEIVVGVASLAAVSAFAVALQALLYLAFLGWVSYALVKKVPLETCGCLGRDDTPPYWGHVVVNAMGVIASTAHALTITPQPEYETVGLVASAVVAGIGALMAWWVIGEGSRTTLRISTR